MPCNMQTQVRISCEVTSSGSLDVALIICDVYNAAAYRMHLL